MTTKCLDFNFTFEPQEDQSILIRETNNQEYLLVPEDTPTLREDVAVLGRLYMQLPSKMRRDFDNSLGMFMMTMLADAENMKSVRTSFATMDAQNAVKH